MPSSYRGIDYTISKSSAPVWRWQVTVGMPKLLRIGEAETEMQAEVQVKSIIDRSFGLQRQIAESWSSRLIC